MGTNYYFFPKGFGFCECCGVELPSLHIGKQSYGWAFTLHGVENSALSLGNWPNWRAYIVATMQSNPKAVIVSDNNSSVSLEALEQLVMKPTDDRLHGSRLATDDQPYDVLFSDFS